MFLEYYIFQSFSHLTFTPRLHKENRSRVGIIETKERERKGELLEKKQNELIKSYKMWTLAKRKDVNSNIMHFCYNFS